MSVLQGACNVEIKGGIFIAHAAGGSNAFKDLSSAAAHTALHDSAARFDAPRCHQNTRAKYRDQLELWMLGQGEDFEGKQLIWLHGGAGAGKSAIMQSVVEQCTQHGTILGTFFFSRADPSRNYAEVLIPTLAYQVARAFPEAMVVLDPLIQRNPLIFKASLHTQALELLIRPLLHLFKNGFLDSTSHLRRVFIIDGLDECSDPQKQALIIGIIASLLCDHDLPICFLVASRPELAISSAFAREKHLDSKLTIIALENDADAESDIRQFIEDSFLDILDSHPWGVNIELPWPAPKSIDLLVWKSSGHFIYAATAMKFIESSDEHPQRALKVVEGLEPSRTGSPFAQLDALYMHILTSAKYSIRVLEILRHRYLSLGFYGYSVVSVCYVHNITAQDVCLFLSDAQSLVALAPDETGGLCIAPRHASLGDFIRDEARSQGLYISGEDYHKSLLARYFHLLDAGPKKLATLSGSIVDYEDVSDSVIFSLGYALRWSEDANLVFSLVTSHSPHNIWNFCVESLALIPAPQSYDEVMDSAAHFSGDYICALRDSVSLDNTQYAYQLRMHIELVLDHIKVVHREPQYRTISALLFSSGRSGLSLASELMFRNTEFYIQDRLPGYIFGPLRRHDRSREVDPRAYEVIKQMPQSKLSWTSDLTIAMTLFIKQLVCLSGPGPAILHSSPHREWLRRHKGLKHISLGSPRISSAVAHRINGTDMSSREWKRISFLYSCWDRLQRLYWKKIAKPKAKCRALMKAVIFYLHKADCTNELVVLARRSLPMAALRFPKLMKRARAEMDAYVRRWEESQEGLLEMTKALHINDMD